MTGIMIHIKHSHKPHVKYCESKSINQSIKKKMDAHTIVGSITLRVKG